MKKSIITCMALSTFLVVNALASNNYRVGKKALKVKKELTAATDTIKFIANDDPGKRETKNRNVMLNAESATSPRTINIGIPISGDIVIEENNVPVTYTYFPTLPTAMWYVDNSMGAMGMLTFGETAIRSGKVGLAIESQDRHYTNKFHGFATIATDNFGSSRYNVTLTGALNKKHGWGYMVDFYQNNDRTNGTNWKFYNWKERTTQAKIGIEKKLKNNGYIRFLYKFMDHKSITTNYSPMIYEGNGKTKELDNFKIARDAFVVGDGVMPYFDPYTGEAKTANYADNDYLRGQSHSFYLDGENHFQNGWLNKWTLDWTAEFMHANTPMTVNFPISLMASMPDQQGTTAYYYHNTNKQYTGSIAWIDAMIVPQCNNNYIAGRAELKRAFRSNSWTLGLNMQHNFLDYMEYTSMYITTVEPNPSLLDMYAYGKYNVTSSNGALPANYGGGYGSRNKSNRTKTALYLKDDLKLNARWTASLGFRAEDLNMIDYHWANGYYYNKSGSKVYQTLNEAEYMRHNFGQRFDWDASFNTLYKVGQNWGVLADATALSWWDCYWDYECRDTNNNPTANTSGVIRESTPGTYRSTVTNSGIGLYWNWSNYIQLVSKVLYTTKSHIRYGDATITNPANSAERTDCGPIYYGMHTLGWTTDIMSNPFKGFNFHFLITWQKPQYKDFSYTAYGVTYDYSGNTIISMSKLLMEIDPSYQFCKNMVRAWVSLRYFGKQYGNMPNAFYYNGWWENFGGIDVNLSRNFGLKFQVTNFLNQHGVKGDIQGASQITNASSYYGRILMASGITPRTFSITANFKF